MRLVSLIFEPRAFHLDFGALGASSKNSKTVSPITANCASEIFMGQRTMQSAPIRLAKLAMKASDSLNTSFLKFSSLAFVSSWSSSPGLKYGFVNFSNRFSSAQINLTLKPASE